MQEGTRERAEQESTPQAAKQLPLRAPKWLNICLFAALQGDAVCCPAIRHRAGSRVLLPAIWRVEPKRLAQTLCANQKELCELRNVLAPSLLSALGDSACPTAMLIRDRALAAHLCTVRLCRAPLGHSSHAGRQQTSGRHCHRHADERILIPTPPWLSFCPGPLLLRDTGTLPRSCPSPPWPRMLCSTEDGAQL